jgi:hypothetical protein
LYKYVEVRGQTYARILFLLMEDIIKLDLEGLEYENIEGLNISG